MTSQRPLQKLKNWAGWKAKISPGAGWNRMTAMAREVFQVDTNLGVSWKSKVTSPHHVFSFVCHGGTDQDKCE